MTPISRTHPTQSIAQLTMLTAIAVLGIILSVVIVKSSALISLALAAGLSLSLICLNKPEIGLHLLVLSMLLSPEFGQRTAAAGGGSNVTLRLDDLLLALIGLSWLVRMATHTNLGLFLKTPINRPIFLYLAVCLVASSLGALTGNVKPVRSFFHIIKYFEYYFIFFMLVNHLERQDQIQRLVVTLLLTCLITDIYGLLQIPDGQRVTAPFEGKSGEPNTLGGYLVMMTAVSASLALYSNKRWLSLLLWGVSSLNIVVLMFTKSRGSYLAFIAMGLTLLLLTKRKIILVFTLLTMLIGPFVLPQAVKERIIYTFTKQQSSHLTVGKIDLDPSTSDRLKGWIDGLKALVKRPLLGYGVTGYRFVDSHFLLVLMDTGIIGFLAFAGLIIALIKAGWHSLQASRSPLGKGLATSFLVSTAALMVHALSANTFIIIRIMEPYWFLAGLTVMAPLVERKNA
ncbi:MAG: O-antigen ligase family protein [Proteobacteria bacterium]|nr:hypothetical protein [Desulfobulbaceae bacterium]MBU4154123.1 O-antigen ligase family protein [Pseudomonadota bacterium]MDP2106492.1 O-antigen ligase family protein [Desulfobulbaceae bacterium]